MNAPIDPGGIPAAISDNANLPALTPQAGLMDGTDGTTRLGWARYRFQPQASGYGNVSVHGGRHSKEGQIASAIAGDLQFSNPLVATIISELDVHTVGNGLTLSSKPDLARFGVAPAEIRDLSNQIETAWQEYASNPAEVDFTGRHDLHALASAAFRSALIHGEIVATLDWRRFPGCRTFTKVALLDPAQLDRTRTLQDATTRTVMGVAFTPEGRLSGYWLKSAPLGNQIVAPSSRYVPATTAWGRPKVVHVFALQDPRQVRGFSPIAAALTPAHEKETLSEFTLASAYLQTQFSLTVESDLSPEAAFAGLSANMQASGMGEWIQGRKDWYSAATITPTPGVVNHLAPGDKLKFNRSETPNSTFDSFDKSLTRRAARAAGMSYEQASGDYSQTSFSASRMASDAPHRVVLKRRKEILEAFLKPVFRAWLEEAIETGRIRLPNSAPPFFVCPEAYCNAKWLGSARIEPDRMKAALASKTELELGLTTLTDELGSRGIDFETHLETLKAEQDAMKSLGLVHPYWADKSKAGNLTYVENHNAQ